MAKPPARRAETLPSGYSEFLGEVKARVAAARAQAAFAVSAVLLGAALTTFDRAMPAPDSELVRDALKDPYNFEFLSLSADARSCGASSSSTSRSRTSSRSSPAR